MISHNSSQVRDKNCSNINISTCAHKIKTITITKKHQIHLGMVIIHRCTQLYTGNSKINLETTDLHIDTGNARSSKEGHETSSAKASESLPFECSP